MIIHFDKHRIIEFLHHERRRDLEIYNSISSMIPGKDEKYAGFISQVNAFEAGENWLHLVSKIQSEDLKKESRKGLAIRFYIIKCPATVKRIHEIQSDMRKDPIIAP